MSFSRVLNGVTVGISVSTSGDIDQLGFDSADVDRCVSLMSDALLGAGARIAFGHDWRPGGVMEAVAESAARYITRSFSRTNKIESAPLVLNRVAYPDVPFFSQESEFAQSRKKALDGIVDSQSILFEQKTGAVEVDRANALTALRVELNLKCNARICIGGLRENYQGWFPGIAEEIDLSLKAGQPVIISTLFGGVSNDVAQALKFRKMLTFRARPIIPNGVPDAIVLGYNEFGYIGAGESQVVDFSSIDQTVEGVLGGLFKIFGRDR